MSEFIMKRFFLNKDQLGILLSSLCGLHCLLTPIVMLLPFTHSVLGPIHHKHEQLHLILFFMVLPLAFTVVYKSIKHNYKTLLFYVLSGLLILTVSVLNSVLHFTEHGSSMEILLGLLGSALLIWSHFKSLKLCKLGH